MRKTLILMILSALVLGVISCKKETETEVETLEGQPGNPRFNLQFNNENEVDLDLHVLTPSGEEISYLNTFADGGTLDVDCLCTSCPSGPNENIFWVDGTAPTGVYKFWVEYYDNCNGINASSEFTLRLLKNNEVIQKYTGILSFPGDQSDVYTFRFQ